MSFLKRLLGNLNKHHGQYRSSHNSGYDKSHHKRKNHDNYYLSRNESQGVTCTRCQTFNAPGARFCGQCGQGVQNIVCSCGASIPAGAKFCGQCGNSL
ncbi:Double zinc ribbon [Legionella gratiana]|uniref:Double zinc ribbon n=1 Tax=Legionella gratiana TaxID=45066 RepID=A0A378J9V8_9GAMM|nr:zinc ribbon domain-containing protein [Legionella gratiana]KTD11561.1 Double zinc ribbon [Legionella gratiana]STX41360.1 Double zinc ribbon [Legionella gratiana]